MISISKTLFALLGAVASTISSAQTLSPPSGSPPRIIVGSGSPSPADITEPNQFLDCSVKTLQSDTHNFQIRNQGGRGYIDPKTGKTSLTQRSPEVVSDPSGLFVHYAAWTSFNDRFHASSTDDNAKFGRELRLELHRTDFDLKSGPPRIWAISVQAYFGWMPLTKAVGFCNVTYSPQTPLSPGEVAALELK